MYIRLDPHSGEAIYRQIVEAIKYRVASGQLTEGDQLPSIRALADELRINMRTVVKAYEALREAGLVVMRQGQGVFITASRGGVSSAARRRTIEELARRLLAESARLGAGADEVLEIIARVARQMEPVE
jgi:GntR family transcriptional regulator